MTEASSSDRVRVVVSYSDRCDLYTGTVILLSDRDMEIRLDDGCALDIADTDEDGYRRDRSTSEMYLYLVDGVWTIAEDLDYFPRPVTVQVTT